MEPHPSQDDSSGGHITKFMLIVSMIISTIGFFLFVPRYMRNNSGFPSDEEMIGLLMLTLGGVMFLVTGLIWAIKYWQSKD